MNTDREKMSSVDKAWLQMECADNLMMITAVLIFEAPIEPTQLRTILAERLLYYQRFKQKIIYESDEVYWQDDAHFDMDHHLTVIGLPGDGDQKALQVLASDISNLPLDFHKPLWHMYFVDRYKLSNQHDGCALIVRMHHCIADGISLVRVLLSITDDSPELVPPHRVKPSPAAHEDWLSPARQLWQRAYHLGHDAVEEGIDLFQHPSHLLELAQKGLEIGSELSHIGLMQADADSCLKRPLSGRKHVAWSEPLALPAVKATARNLRGTVNDVLVCCAAGALHCYLAEHQTLALDAILRLVVPVNLRPLEQPITTLGNQFGMIMVDLPIGETDTKRRFFRVRENLVRQKQSQQAEVFYGMLSVLGKGPSSLEQIALEMLSKNASAVMTNVPGPKQSVFLAGSRLVQPIVWVPQSGQVGVGLSILSYDGIVQFGFIADKALVPDPKRVVKYFVESYRELERL